MKKIPNECKQTLVGNFFVMIARTKISVYTKNKHDIWRWIMNKILKVKNSKGHTTGFFVDNSYVTYNEMLVNIDLETSLTITQDGVIEARNGKLAEISIKDVNRQIYDKLMSENSIERDIADEMEHWRIYGGNRALFVNGARQVGKTTEILKFAYKNFEQIIYINLAEEINKQMFEEMVVNNPNKRYGFMKFCKKRGYENFENDESTVVILDEIQESFLTYNAIRSLLGELQSRLIITGSYLGQTLKAEFFQPAGNTYEIELLPLSFREFCRVFHSDTLLMDINIFGKSDSSEYEKLTNLYQIYRQIGGYPAVVKEYKISENMDRCFKVLQGLVNRFTAESTRYFKETMDLDKCKLIFQNVYRATAYMLAHEKKGADTGAKAVDTVTTWIKDSTKELVTRNEVSNAISWLIYSGITGNCDLYSKGSINDILFDRRTYFKDNGILNYILSTTTMKQSSVEGVLTENFAYTELYRLHQTNKVKGIKPCFSTYNEYELDFLVVGKDDKKYGLEIKTSNSNKPKSLNEYVRLKLVDEGIVAGITRGGIRQDFIKSIPIYTIGERFPYEQMEVTIIC